MYVGLRLWLLLLLLLLCDVVLLAGTYVGGGIWEAVL
jgi:hypothetical protein